MTRILHVSDNHGTFPKLFGNFDCILSTGDFFPNSEAVRISASAEEAFQLEWLRQKMMTIKSWINGRFFLFVHGNHDFLNPALMQEELQKNGIFAYHLDEKIFNYRGIKIYGFPYVPNLNSEIKWTHQLQVPEMQIQVDKMVDVINNDKVDIIAAHCPIYGCLDEINDGTQFGNTVMANALDYKIKQDMMPKHFLCGHVHQACGVTLRNNVLVSNAATNQHIICVNR